MDLHQVINDNQPFLNKENLYKRITNERIQISQK